MRTTKVPPAAVRARSVDVRVVEGQEFLDHVLFNEPDLFDWPDRRREETAFKLVQHAFTHHYRRSSVYRIFCDGEGFSPDQLVTPGSLASVPLVSSLVFKHRLLRTCAEDEVVKLCLSSGTQGSQSRIPRDNPTLERFLGSTQTIADQMLGSPPRGQVFNLGPDTEEVRDLWFSYVMSMLDLLYPAAHFVRNEVFYPSSVVKEVRALQPRVRAMLVGPPVMFLQLLQFMEKRNLRLDLAERDGIVVTAGGWKRFMNEAIDPAELRARLVDRLGLEGQERVRDAFNMVELNTVLIECEHHRKHVPPWLVVTARDPGTLSVLRPGQAGLLAYLDPTATSYPAFILSDDFGRIVDAPCLCSRTGPTFEILRRVKRIEARGCALKMERSISMDEGSGEGAE